MDGAEIAAHQLAAKGADLVERVAAIAERARTLLEDPYFKAAAGEEETAFHAWQVQEQLPIGAPRQTRLASVEDFTTGEGGSICFMIGHTRTEHELRRILAQRLGAEQANRATVAEGSNALVSFHAVFLSPALRRTLGRIESGDCPATFSFFARIHSNYS